MTSGSVLAGSDKLQSADALFPPAQSLVGYLPEPHHATPAKLCGGGGGAGATVMPIGDGPYPASAATFHHVVRGTSANARAICVPGYLVR